MSALVRNTNTPSNLASSSALARNREEMKKDAAARVAILAALERQLKKGDKSLVGNKGYRRFLATPGDDRFAIDRRFPP